MHRFTKKAIDDIAKEVRVSWSGVDVDAYVSDEECIAINYAVEQTYLKLTSKEDERVKLLKGTSVGATTQMLADDLNKTPDSIKHFKSLTRIINRFMTKHQFPAELVEEFIDDWLSLLSKIMTRK